MSRKIRFCLLYRDMWQSSGKYVPRVDQLTRVAQPIIDMGCFARVETNGGGFEQINLLFGENPNKAVREWTQPFNDAGIQTQMLERGLNGIRMRPVPKDIRKLMFSLKKKQGTDIARSFDGLNDARNLEHSILYAKEGGMISQGCLCITHSKIHSVDYYIGLADTLIDMGAQEICLKDMAGIGRPASQAEVVHGIKKRHPEVLVQYHGHSTPGFSVASALQTALAGADIIDVGMEPLSWGTGHADLLTIHAMLKDAGFEVPDIDMKAYMKVRALTQEFIDDFLGEYISPRNRQMNSLLIGSGLPGGMMGSLMADLEANLETVNRSLKKQGRDEMNQDDLLIRLFEEVEYVWPKLGYPPLVTPYSQYVKNVALMNLMQMVKGKERWSMIAEDTWSMILGRSGTLPGDVDEEIKSLAAAQNREFFKGEPVELYEDELPTFQKEMADRRWERGQDDEELFELAMHPEQYRNYKSGKAKESFEKDLAGRREAKTVAPPAPVAPAASASAAQVAEPKTMNVEVNGEKFLVHVSYGNGQAQAPAVEAPGQMATNGVVSNGAHKEIIAPIEGNFMLTKSPEEKSLKIGDTVSEGDLIGYIESMKVYNAITADKSGLVAEIRYQSGDKVIEDDVLVILQ